MKEKVKKFIGEHKAEVIVGGIYLAGFLTGLAIGKAVSPSRVYVPVKEDVKIFDKEVSDHELELLNDAFESLHKQGIVLCSRI